MNLGNVPLCGNYIAQVVEGQLFLQAVKPIEPPKQKTQKKKRKRRKND